jgi:signal transduction histidine kinase
MFNSMSPSNKPTSKSNVADLQEIAKSIYERNAELVKLDRMKDEFVSIVSHELRTPLTIIKNYLWLVTHENKDQVGPDALKKIQIVIQSTERLMLLVEDTLTVSRIENGKISLKKEPLDLVARVEYILDIYHIQAEAKGIRVVLETDLETANIHADINKIHEVIVNVYGNALKFTPKDGVIRIKIRKSDEGTTYQIAITDSGPGIPTEKQDKLFTKFGKIDESYANLPNINGTGLGLYISQEIMKLHGGSITVESEYGHGATFIVNLPIGE